MKRRNFPGRIVFLAAVLVFVTISCSSPPDARSGYAAQSGYEYEFYEGLEAVERQCVSNLFGSLDKMALYGVVREDESLEALYTQIDRELTMAFAVDRSRPFRIMEREALDQALKETQFNINEAVRDPAEMASVGEFLAADAILVASLTPFSVYFRLGVRILSTETGELLSSGVVNIWVDEELLDAFQARHAFSAFASGEAEDERRAKAEEGGEGVWRILVSEQGAYHYLLQEILRNREAEGEPLPVELTVVQDDELIAFLEDINRRREPLPDAIIADQDAYALLRDYRLLEPLEELPIPWEQIHPKARMPYESGRSVFAVPLAFRAFPVLCRNREKVPEPPASWDGLTALLEKNSSLFVYPTGFGWFLHPPILSADPDFFSRPEADFRSPAFLRGAALLRRLTPGETLRYDEAQERFLSGDAGLIMNGSWAVPEYRERLGDKLGVSAVPGKVLFDVTALMITREGAERLGGREDARQALGHLLAILLSEEYQRRNMAVENGLTVLEPLWGAAAEEELGSEIADAYRITVERGEPYPARADIGRYWETLNRLSDLLNDKEMPIPEYGARLQRFFEK